MIHTFRVKMTDSSILTLVVEGGRQTAILANLLENADYVKVFCEHNGMKQREYGFSGFKKWQQNLIVKGED